MLHPVVYMLQILYSCKMILYQVLRSVSGHEGYRRCEMRRPKLQKLEEPTNGKLQSH